MTEQTILAIDLPQIEIEGLLHKTSVADIHEAPDLILINLQTITLKNCTSLIQKYSIPVWGVLHETISPTLSKHIFTLPPLQKYVHIESAIQHIDRKLHGGSNKKIKKLEEELSKIKKELAFKDDELKALDEAMRSLSSMTQPSSDNSAEVSALEKSLEQKEFQINELEVKNQQHQAQIHELKEQSSKAQDDAQKSTQELQNSKITIRQLEDERATLRLDLEQAKDKAEQLLQSKNS